ncbi:hypothetical protein HV356_17425 [Citrobacter sp. RHBSTW-01065]|nr:hypothetical protein [Citrobacter sp. RHBSTW-01065]
MANYWRGGGRENEPRGIAPFSKSNLRLMIAKGDLDIASNMAVSSHQCPA